jgi:hypothetical protein
VIRPTRERVVAVGAGIAVVALSVSGLLALQSNDSAPASPVQAAAGAAVLDTPVGPGRARDERVAPARVNPRPATVAMPAAIPLVVRPAPAARLWVSVRERPIMSAPNHRSRVLGHVSYATPVSVKGVVHGTRPVARDSNIWVIAQQAGVKGYMWSRKLTAENPRVIRARQAAKLRLQLVSETTPLSGKASRSAPVRVKGGSPQAIARSMMAAEYGWGSGQFSCLRKLWQKESNWNPRADNPTSSAYGIPQALPGRKMASAGPDWRTNPATQIEWGLGYIAGRYRTPCGAWAHSQSHGWY